MDQIYELFNKPQNIFYSYSTKCGSSSHTHELINERIDLIYVDNNDNPYILDKILEQIDDSDIFGCDIAPDASGYTSPNVILELGYAIRQIGLENIIIILDGKIKESDISMLGGIQKEKYWGHSEDDIGLIIDKINLKMNSIKEKRKYKKIDYKLSERSVDIVVNLLDIRYNGYKFMICAEDGSIMILFNCYDGESRIIDVNAKKLLLKKKEICLFHFK